MGSLNGPALNLSVARADGTAVATRIVGPAGAWIGRASDCEIVLPDPERLVSGHHCRIDFADDTFWITDQSTNGTFLNGSTVALPKGERQPLAAGDRLRVGRFVVTTAPASADKPIADVASVTASADATASPLLDPPWALQPAAAAAPGEQTLLAQFPSEPKVPAQAAGAADTLSALLTDLLAESPIPPPQPQAAPAMPALDQLPEFAQAPLPSPMPDPPPREPEPAPAASPAPPPSSPPSPSTVDELVSALASEIAPSQPAEAPRALAQPSGSGALEVYPPERSGAAATRALAAFWCGLGVMPSGLDPAGLAKIMMELGAALREAVDGFADFLGPANADGHGAANPFADGHAGLRRAIARHGDEPPRIDDLVRTVFAMAAEREDAYIAAVRTALQHALRSMTATALESRFGPLLQSRRQSARRAELMDLMFKMEAELIELAEAQFRKELSGLMQQRIRRRVTFEGGGPHG